ncbi:MAG: peptidoglycan DD-metalloendopeptidase family protein [Clostridium celatum]|nr:peptidoglycan DD-metalloendopeptidase family protein [Clostridium celatum]MDU2123855.1 peptidoglycan DD-metalloendopeptidase family protein [Clostridium celatum]MDU4980535.1 peptidoglycan DD-metalloendopeptidase family protein [Clostridium celatum]
MDVNGQNNISIWLKVLKKISVLMFMTLIFMVPDNNVYANSNTRSLEENELILKDRANNESSVENLVSDENTDNKLNTVDVFNYNTNNIFTINLKGNSIRLVDNTVGLTSLSEDKYSVLEEICNSYVNELGIDVNNITAIQVMGTINSDIEKSRISSLNLSGEIAKEVYDSYVINENLLGLDFKINLTESEVIEPETVTEECNDLYVGETETVQGGSGISLVSKEIIYDGLNKNQEKVVSKKVVKPAVNTIVKVGTKNPYYAGVAFLSNPTNGGYLSSYFGEVRAKSVHKGIDIAKNLGESVNASLDGKVISAGYNNGGYGNLIVIEHPNNMKTYYAHLNDIYVNVGDMVKKDDIIGAVGSTGNSTGPHLHFELRVDNKPVDPIKYIKQ